MLYIVGATAAQQECLCLQVWCVMCFTDEDSRHVTGAMPEKSAATEIREHGDESAFAGLSKAVPIKNRPLPLPKDLINPVEIN